MNNLLRLVSCLWLATALTTAFVPQCRQISSGSSLGATAAPWFRQKLASEYAQKRAVQALEDVNANKPLDEVELVEALEESVKVDLNEVAARSLLSYRLELESAQAEQKAKAKREKAARNLLEYRLQLENSQKGGGSWSFSQTMKQAKGRAKDKLKAYKVKAETTARALLSYRVKLDKKQAQERSKTRREKSIRALLSYRLRKEAEMKSLGSFEEGDARRMIKPWNAAEEKKRAAKYASIDCIGERAYTILMDLGMVNPALDFSI